MVFKNLIRPFLRSSVMLNILSIRNLYGKPGLAEAVKSSLRLLKGQSFKDRRKACRSPCRGPGTFWWSWGLPAVACFKEPLVPHGECSFGFYAQSGISLVMVFPPSPHKFQNPIGLKGLWKTFKGPLKDLMKRLQKPYQGIQKPWKFSKLHLKHFQRSFDGL